MKFGSLSLVSCTLFLVFLVNNAQSFKLQQHSSENVLSEDHMFDHNDNKEVKFFKPITPSKNIKNIKQVGGLDVDLDGRLIVFHRGNRRWSFDTFVGNMFNRERYGPIKENVLSLIDTSAKHSTSFESWGKNRFYMPHGLTVDHDGNIWLTDVGLHQVFKFNFRESEEPQLVLGVAFKDGSDSQHFCKPTDVAIAKSDGDIFVSDGYCNQRVVQFDKDGNFVKEFKDTSRPLFIAHSITLIENLNLVCTVSREEGRIVCFDIDTGIKKHEITDSSMLTVYAIKYDPDHEVLHAATGDNHNREASGLTFDAKAENFGKLLKKWDSENRDLKEVHDIAISPEGSAIYVGQLNGEIDEFTFE